MPKETLKKCPKCGRKASFCAKRTRMTFEELEKATEIELVCFGEAKDKYGYRPFCKQVFIYHPRTGKITARGK